MKINGHAVCRVVQKLCNVEARTTFEIVPQGRAEIHRDTQGYARHIGIYLGSMYA